MKAETPTPPEHPSDMAAIDAMRADLVEGILDQEAIDPEDHLAQIRAGGELADLRTELRRRAMAEIRRRRLGWSGGTLPETDDDVAAEIVTSYKPSPG